MRKCHCRNEKGIILVFALWSLGVLSVLAVNIAMNTRQKITFLSQIEKRSQLNYLVDGGIKKAMAIIKADTVNSSAGYTGFNKLVRHNNPGFFSNINVGFGTAEVTYWYVPALGDTPEKRFGVVDEMSKLNINEASFDELRRLFVNVLNYSDIKAQELANAIIEWRQPGGGHIPGLFNASYYASLKYPYSAKQSRFEVLDELLLVKGINQATYQKLINYVTVYGPGQVNINTASWPVLLSLGLSNQLVDKILSLRRGEDQEDDTRDDYIFTAAHDIGAHLAQFYDVTNIESREIDQLNFQKKLSVNSFLYSINAAGKLLNSHRMKTISCVYDVGTKKVMYWRET